MCWQGRPRRCAVVVVLVTLGESTSVFVLYFWVIHIIPLVHAFFCILFPFFCCCFWRNCNWFFLFLFLLCLRRVVPGVCGPFWLTFPYFFCARVWILFFLGPAFFFYMFFAFFVVFFYEFWMMFSLHLSVVFLRCVVSAVVDLFVCFFRFFFVFGPDVHPCLVLCFCCTCFSLFLIILLWIS